MSRTCRTILATLSVLDCLCSIPTCEVAAGQYAKISDDLDLYYEDVGQGPPIILVPGWTASEVVFSR